MKKTPLLIEFPLPLFDGFYHSVSQEMADTYEENYPDEDHSQYHEKIAKGFLSSFNKLTKQEFQFVRIDSPKEYNFNTDKIIVTGRKERLRTIWKNVRKLHKDFSCFEDVLREQLTPCDGFIPFYSNDPLDWLAKDFEEFDQNELGIIVEAYCMFNDVYFDAITEQPEYYESLS